MSLILWQTKELWSKDLNIQSVVDWDEIYKANYLCTIETKMCSFQIKLILRVVVTNIQLFGFGSIEFENCKFCNKTPETLLHHFFTCSVVVTYWENVSACISRFLKDLFSFNNFNKVFGVPKIKNRQCLTFYFSMQDLL